MAWQIRHYTQLDSSNDEAHRLIRAEKIPDRTVILAGFQTNGKGQNQHVWYSESGVNLLSSWIVRPHFLPIEDQFMLSMVAAISVVNTLERLDFDKVSIKWPNDILLDGKKVCGILISNIIKHQRLDYSIIGIGLNVNQIQFSTDAPHATSLTLASGQYYELTIIGSILGQELEDNLKLLSHAQKDIYHAYSDKLWRMGQRIQLLVNGDPIMAKILGVDFKGKLKVEIDGVKTQLLHGECKIPYL